MNCPFHVEIYKNSYYSYRDLPLRWAELGTVYRYERSGAMQGLFRVRGFTQVSLGSSLATAFRVLEFSRFECGGHNRQETLPSCGHFCTLKPGDGLVSTLQ